MSENEKRDRELNLTVREQIQLSPDSPFVYQPRFVNKERTKVRAIVRMPDGRLNEMEADCSDVKSPLRRDVFAQYTESEIQMFTERYERMLEAKREVDKRALEDKAVSEQRDATYRAKAEAFQIPEIAALEDRELVRKIRQARNVSEVMAWTAVALRASLEKAPPK